ncbi:MAG: hypothetical protein R3B07_10930 [Polyangiaceae bacterium]
MVSNPNLSLDRAAMADRPLLEQLMQLYCYDWSEQGVGYAAARAVFDTFRVPWEVRQRSENIDATRFWRTIIDRYTSGAYTEVRHDERGWSGVVQRFSNA